jgi:hypothetical protein
MDLSGALLIPLIKRLFLQKHKASTITETLVMIIRPPIQTIGVKSKERMMEDSTIGGVLTIQENIGGCLTAMFMPTNRNNVKFYFFILLRI